MPRQRAELTQDAGQTAVILRNSGVHSVGWEGSGRARGHCADLGSGPACGPRAVDSPRASCLGHTLILWAQEAH